MDNGASSSQPHMLDLRDRNMAALALAQAMDRMREDAKSAAPAELSEAKRGVAAMARLDDFRQKLEPLFAAIPADAEGFDLGFVTGNKPRLFIDMISYVDADPDTGSLRLVQEGRSGRRVLLETLDESVLLSRITEHVAERLVAREQALEAQELLDARLILRKMPVAEPMQVTQTHAPIVQDMPTPVPPMHVAPVHVASDYPSNAQPMPANVAAAPAVDYPAMAKPAVAASPVQAAQAEARSATISSQRSVRREGSSRVRLHWPSLALLVGLLAAAYTGYLMLQGQLK